MYTFFKSSKKQSVIVSALSFSKKFTLYKNQKVKIIKNPQFFLINCWAAHFAFTISIKILIYTYCFITISFSIWSFSSSKKNNSVSKIDANFTIKFKLFLFFKNVITIEFLLSRLFWKIAIELGTVWQPIMKHMWISKFRFS